jgi:hypothetical protein
MDPTTSFVLALIAMAISAASAIIAGVSVHQTKKYRPRADLEVKRENSVVWSQDPNIPYAEVSVVNHGDGPVRDVKIVLHTATRKGVDTWSDIPAIGSPGFALVKVPLWRISSTVEHGWHPPDIPTETVFPTMTVSWRREDGKGRVKISKLIDGDGWKPMGSITVKS